MNRIEGEFARFTKSGLAVMLLATTGGADTRVPNIDDMVGLKRVSQPAISPDGSRVAYFGSAGAK